MYLLCIELRLGAGPCHIYWGLKVYCPVHRNRPQPDTVVSHMNPIRVLKRLHSAQPFLISLQLLNHFIYTRNLKACCPVHRNRPQPDTVMSHMNPIRVLKSLHSAQPFLISLQLLNHFIYTRNLKAYCPVRRNRP